MDAWRSGKESSLTHPLTPMVSLCHSVTSPTVRGLPPSLGRAWHSRVRGLRGARGLFRGLRSCDAAAAAADDWGGGAEPPARAGAADGERRPRPDRRLLRPSSDETHGSDDDDASPVAASSFGVAFLFTCEVEEIRQVTGNS